MAKFEVQVAAVVEVTTWLDVEADSEEEARVLAVKYVTDGLGPIEWEQPDYKDDYIDESAVAVEVIRI